MKTKVLAWAGAATALLLGGCVVTSVCPYYTQKDLVFEPGILGNWINQKNEAELWKFEKSGDLAYRFTLIEARKATVMEAHAFKLDGQLFLDIFSLEQDVHVIPAHYLVKVSELAPNLKFTELKDEWLAGLLEKDTKLLRHHFVQFGDNANERRLVLLASTPELQSFVIKHTKTAEAWSDTFELRRELLIKTAQAR